MVTQAKRMKTEHEGATVNSLSWDLPVHLIGEKYNETELLNCCMLCCLPILTYGRMIPCKHVLCLDCARKHSSTICAKCGEKVTRIEQCQLGTVFVCSFGSPRHGPGGCRRTYLSYRDMEAHIKHRHAKKDNPPTIISPLPAITQPQSIPNQSAQYIRQTIIPPPGHMLSHPPSAIGQASSIQTNNIPVVSHPHHVHPIQPNAVSMQTNIAPVSARSMTANAMMMQGNPSGIPVTPVHHTIPAHVIPPPVHQPRLIRPPPQSGPMRQHNPAGSSKSHGNLISIPIQGAADDTSYNTWRGNSSSNQPQQWQSSNRNRQFNN